MTKQIFHGDLKLTINGLILVTVKNEYSNYTADPAQRIKIKILNYFITNLYFFIQ